MYKYSPSRNQRSKRFKVTQVIQICVLVAACFWLIYQVQHSHDKRKDFEETDALSLSDTNFHNLNIGGRKGLHGPLEKEPSIKTKNVEAETEEENEVEEDDTKLEENVEEDNNKHEEEEEEQEREKSETENEHDIDILDEERDKEEVDENEDKEAENEDENQVEDHDHEAREEHYKGDDASSAVTHESESVSAKIENRYPENNIEKMESSRLEDGKIPNITGSTVNNNTTGEIAENVISLNVTMIGKEKSENVISKQEETPVSRSTTMAKSDINQEETGKDLAKTSKATNGPPVMNSTEVTRSVDEEDIIMKSSLNKTRSDSNSVDIQNTETVQRESLNSSIISKTVVSENEKTDVKIQENRNENFGSEKEMADNDTEKGGIDHHDPIDDSDTTVSVDKDMRTNADNLQDIRTEGSNNKKAAFE